MTEAALLKLETVIDNILKDPGMTGVFNLEIYTKDLTNDEARKLHRMISHQFVYADQNTYGRLFTLNDTGRQAKLKGGHFKYKEYLLEKENEERIDKQTERELLFYNKENAKITFEEYNKVKRERNALFIFAAIELLAILIGLIYQLTKQS